MNVLGRDKYDFDHPPTSTDVEIDERRIHTNHSEDIQETVRDSDEEDIAP